MVVVVVVVVVVQFVFIPWKIHSRQSVDIWVAHHTPPALSKPRTTCPQF